MIITLCGSARFEGLFHGWNEKLTLAGHVVFSLSVYPSFKGEKDWYTKAQKTILDSAHKRKINLSEAVVILNRGGYMGDSTRSEESYAISQGKGMYYIEGDKGLRANDLL